MAVNESERKGTLNEGTNERAPSFQNNELTNPEARFESDERGGGGEAPKGKQNKRCIFYNPQTAGQAGNKGSSTQCVN